MAARVATKSGMASDTDLPDSEHKGLMGLLPRAARPYASLARFDRPIGWWLLYWPCAWGLALAGGVRDHWPLFFWLLLGAIAMRGAGCVYNDIVDRDLDARVARTANRPLASGAVSVKAAWVWLALLCAIGLIVLLQLRGFAQIIALGSLALVAAYPFMKRIGRRRGSGWYFHGARWSAGRRSRAACRARRSCSTPAASSG